MWTSAALDRRGPRVGIPAYVLIAQMLYQRTLADALEEARRAQQAGWFTFLLADEQGQLACVEASPEEKVIETGRGAMARVYWGTRRMTKTPPDKPVPRHKQCQRMYDLLEAAKGRVDRAAVQGFFADHQCPLCKHVTTKKGGGTLDAMVFDTRQREALVVRGPVCTGRWQRFTF